MASPGQVNAEVTGTVFKNAFVIERQEGKVWCKVGWSSSEQQIGEGATGSRRRCARTWGRLKFGERQGGRR